MTAPIELYHNDDGGPIGAPHLHAVAVTPSDSVDLANPCAGIVVQVAGNIKVTPLGDSVAVVLGIAAGVEMRLRCSRVWSTSTTATGIVALR